MKKAILFLAIITLMAACQKQEIEPTPLKKTITVTIETYPASSVCWGIGTLTESDANYADTFKTNIEVLPGQVVWVAVAQGNEPITINIYYGNEVASKTGNQFTLKHIIGGKK